MTNHTHSTIPTLPSEDNETEWSFSLPVLPTGIELVIKILTTWNDRYYIGLTGIEIFRDTGEKASISEVSCSFIYLSICLYLPV